MVMKLKPKETKADPNPYRVCQCAQCGWLLAAKTVQSLLLDVNAGGAGWATAQDGRKVWGFICNTCRMKHPELVKTMPHMESAFRLLPLAPENAHPKLGMPGHETSSPWKPDDNSGTPTDLN